MEDNTGNSHVLSSSRRPGPEGFRKAHKTRGCRGRKRQAWKLVIHGYMIQDFDFLRVATVEVIRNLFRDIAIDFVNNENIVDLPMHLWRKSWRKTLCRICACGTTWFNAFRVGKTQHPIWEQYCDRSVAWDLGKLCVLFEQGEDEDPIFNLYGTHFIVDVDNGRALGLLE